ncbi:hypothetical protein WA158_007597 [Blastocystis sp. Blastoise]
MMKLLNAYFSTLVVCAVLVLIIESLRKFKLVPTTISRKLTHILIGALFVLCWNFFPDSIYSKWLAASIPFTFGLVFFLIGCGLVKYDNAVRSLCRTGNPHELLLGPVHYGIIITCATLFYWKKVESIPLIMILCFGDGLADVCGQIRKGNYKLIWNNHKSLYGFLAFIIFSILSCLFYGWYFEINNWISINWSEYTLSIIYISIGCALTETFTVPEWDNFTISAMSILLTKINHL